MQCVGRVANPLYLVPALQTPGHRATLLEIPAPALQTLGYRERRLSYVIVPQVNAVLAVRKVYLKLEAWAVERVDYTFQIQQ